MNTTMQKIMATYGHGTENDFVLVFDPDEEISISPSQVAAICNRTSGVGSDGVFGGMTVKSPSLQAKR